MVVVNATLAKNHSVRLDEVNELASALGGSREGCAVSAVRLVGAEFTFGDIQ